MRSKRTLKKAIDGTDCEVFAVIHHDRVRVGRAVPTIEVYEDSTEVPTVGDDVIRYKKTFFSIALCPNPEMEDGLTADKIRHLRSFDLAMQLPRKDGVIVPFLIYAASSAELSPKRWVFEITDTDTVEKLLAL